MGERQPQVVRRQAAVRRRARGRRLLVAVRVGAGTSRIFESGRGLWREKGRSLGKKVGGASPRVDGGGGAGGRLGGVDGRPGLGPGGALFVGTEGTEPAIAFL